MGNRYFEYYVGCFEVFSFTEPLSPSTWNEIQSKLNAEKWKFSGRKLYPIDDIAFSPGSDDMNQLQEIFNEIEERLGELTIRGEIFMVDDYNKKGCRLLKTKKDDSSKHVEVVLYEIGGPGEYFDWEVMEHEHVDKFDDDYVGPAPSRREE